MAISEVNDPVFSSKILGEGVGILPSSGQVVAPVSGEVISVLPHAYGLKTADGAEVLVHIGIDTVQLDGEHFTPVAAVGEHLTAGDPLCTVDYEGVKAAGYDTTTLVTVTNTAAMGSVTPRPPAKVDAGDPVLDVTN